MVFRLQAKQLFLTWPKCTLSKDEALAILQSKLQLDQYIIASELHKDGTQHLHAYIKGSDKYQITNPNKLDLGPFHGNYQTCRSPAAVKAYCKEEEDYITNIPNFQPIAPAIRVLQAENYEDAMHVIKNSSLARDYIRDSAKYEESIARLHPTPTLIQLRYRFKTMQKVVRWKRTKYALWLRGPSGLGKTEFAKSLFSNPLFVTHRDKLKLLNKTHDGIIFDDMSFMHWPRESQIHIIDVQNNRDIDVKHGMVTIPAGMPRIFTSNTVIFMYDPAIQRRLKLVKIIEDVRLLDEDPDPDNDISDVSSTHSDTPLEIDFCNLMIKENI
jgi:hypothetical protein